MAATACTSSQFRSYIEGVFADQLSGTINDKRGDKNSARPRQLEDLPAWEFLSHEAGRAKDPTEAARQRLESLCWGQGAQVLTRAHELALCATRA
jgi:hypothetical protein